MRVVPRENEALNETWISDRDRFGYEGIYSDDRLAKPLVDGIETEWEAALEATAQRLKEIIARHGAESVGFLIAPTATVEELYLAPVSYTHLDVYKRQATLRQKRIAPSTR